MRWPPEGDADGIDGMDTPASAEYCPRTIHGVGVPPTGTAGDGIKAAGTPEAWAAKPAAATGCPVRVGLVQFSIVAPAANRVAGSAGACGRVPPAAPAALLDPEIARPGTSTIGGSSGFWPRTISGSAPASTPSGAGITRLPSPLSPLLSSLIDEESEGRWLDSIHGPGFSA